MTADIGNVMQTYDPLELRCIRINSILQKETVAVIRSPFLL